MPFSQRRATGRQAGSTGERRRYYKREDSEACWRGVRAPLLMLVGEVSEALAKLGTDGSPEALRAIYPQMQLERIPGAGHMLHIERPDALAPLIETFLDAN